VASRYNMQETPTGRFTHRQMKELGKKGSFKWFTNKYPGTNIQKPLYVTKESIEDRNNVDMSVVKNISKCKVLLIHGTGDKVIPFQDAILLEEKIKEGGNHDVRVSLIENASHSFQQEDERVQLSKIVMEWISQNIQQKI